MKKSVAGTVGMMALGAILAAGMALNAIAQEKNSGFLRDYSRLQDSKDAQGQTIRAWISPKLTPSNYDAILMDPVVFYPEPQPSEKVSADTLKNILAYVNSALTSNLGKRFQVAVRAGPGVLRIRIAVTSVAAKEEGLKPYQLVPIAFIATMAARAAEGGAPQRAAIVLEVEATDSVSGELLGLRTRVGSGERLAHVGAQDVVTLDTLKPVFDELAAAALPDLEKYVKASK